jgi:membrane protease YdiL (CAAX protease family)
LMIDRILDAYDFLVEKSIDEEDDDYDNGWLRRELIAPWWEIVLVLAVMLGIPAYSSAHFAMANRSDDFIKHMLTNPSFLHQIAWEGGLLVLFFFYLHWRGWTTGDFKIGIDWRGTQIAPFLAIAAGLAGIITTLALKIGILLYAPHPHGVLATWIAQAPHTSRHSIDVAWTLILVGSTINAYFEELVFMGYAFNQLAAKRSPLFALLVMVFLRMLLHTYKGPIDMIGIAAFSFAYGLAYCYLRRLWPLILGHACTDLVVFSLFKIAFGR